MSRYRLLGSKRSFELGLPGVRSANCLFSLSASAMSMDVDLASLQSASRLAPCSLIKYQQDIGEEQDQVHNSLQNIGSFAAQVDDAYEERQGE